MSQSVPIGGLETLHGDTINWLEPSRMSTVNIRVRFDDLPIAKTGKIMPTADT